MFGSWHYERICFHIQRPSLQKKRKLYTLKTPRLPEYKVSLFLFGHAVFCPAGADWRVIGWLRYILAQCANW